MISMNNMQPFSLKLDFQTGIIRPCNNYLERRISDMAGIYADHEAEQKALLDGDPVIYQVHQYDVADENGHLLVVTSSIHPGKIGDEYYMTKGHYHARRDTAEVYLGMQGHGYLLLCTEEDGFESMPVEPGTITYIPPYWAHRTVNTGSEDFVFFGVYPADAGHDYGTIESEGFPMLLVERDGVPTLVPNPSHGRSA